MTNSLLSDFTVDKATKTVFITREFDADLSLVWDAFTKAELIDQWIAPKPMISKTKYQDFKVGGKTVIVDEATGRKICQAMASLGGHLGYDK